MDQNDKLLEQVKELSENLKDAEVRAEEAERSNKTLNETINQLEGMTVSVGSKVNWFGQTSIWEALMGERSVSYKSLSNSSDILLNYNI